MGVIVFFFQAEDGIRDLVRSRGLGDVYKRQGLHPHAHLLGHLTRDGVLQALPRLDEPGQHRHPPGLEARPPGCLLYTSDAADERSSVDLGGRRIIKQTTLVTTHRSPSPSNTLSKPNNQPPHGTHSNT